MAVQLAKVRLDWTGHGTVELDGQLIEGVRSVTVRAEPNCRPVLVVEILAREVDFQQGNQDKPVEEVPDAAAHG